MPKTPNPVKRSLTPIGDKVLIKEIKSENKSKTGIILPDSVDMRRGIKEGKVIAVGEGKIINGELIELFVQKGDIVLFGSGELIMFDEEEFFLVRESEISAKIK